MQLKVPFGQQLNDEDVVQNYILSASLEVPKTDTPGGVYVTQSEIILIPKKYSVFVQTDKPVYNPGNEMLYRILVLDSELKPYKVRDIKIKIFDGKGNLLIFPKPKNDDDEDNVPETVTESVFESDEDFEPVHKTSRRPGNSNGETPNRLIHRNDSRIFDGLYSYHYNINDEVNVGNWSLKVVIDDEDDFATTKYFEVREYILPRFEVIVKTKHDVQTSDEEIALKVYANYTFGELASGDVKVKASVYDLTSPSVAQKNITRNAVASDAKFEVDFKFNIKDELGIYNSIRPYGVTFNVEFTERLTGQTMTAEAKVRVYKNSVYFLDIVREEALFKPGFNYTVAVTVESFDHQPITSQTNEVKLEVKYLLKSRVCLKVPPEQLEGEQTINRAKRPTNGRAEFKLDVPDTATAIILTATYKDSSKVVNVKRHQGDRDEYIQLEAKKKLG